VDIASQSGVSNRLVLFVDGLHKGQRYTAETFEFLQQLQNTQEFVEARGFGVGTIVAGSADWVRRFKETPSLSGSIHHIDPIPPINEDEAVESAVRRIVAYTREGSAQLPLRKEPLRLAYRVLADRNDQVTFRMFLNHIHNRLQARQFNELGLSVEVHLETVELVQSKILASPLRDGYLRLEKELEDKPRARRAVPKVLAMIFSRRGLTEGSGVFGQHVRVLHLIAATGLLEKRLEQGRLSWHLSKELAKLLQDLYNDHQVLPVDAISGFLVEKTAAARHEVKLIYEGGATSFGEVAELTHVSWPELAVLAG
jgi:hypothetical protein